MRAFDERAYTKTDAARCKMTQIHTHTEGERRNALQRSRRTGKPRIDYYPAPDALTALEARKTAYPPANNYTGILDVIVRKWAAIKGIALPSKGATPATGRGYGPNVSAQLRSTSGLPCLTAGRHPELRPPSRPRAPARLTPARQDIAKPVRVVCGARRRRDGLPCEALSVPGKRRCKWHGGCSTGPRTDERRARALSNLGKLGPKK